MARNTIPKNATIRVIIDRVRYPVPYLRGVHRNMMECKAKYGSAAVRNGQLGEGAWPNYWVEPEGGWFDGEERQLLALEDPEEQRRIRAEVLASCYNAYHGRTHRKLDWGKAELKDDSWSNRSMTVVEIEELLDEVIGKARR